MSATFPLDNGYLRRECPSCLRQFKWHHGPTVDRPASAIDPDVYFCPYCGESAPPQHWWTNEQLQYARGLLAGPAMNMVADSIDDMLRRLPKTGLLAIELQRPAEPEPPPALHEPTDMALLQPPCHPWEPFKVEDEWTGALHCILCGERFAV